MKYSLMKYILLWLSKIDTIMNKWRKEKRDVANKKLRKSSKTGEKGGNGKLKKFSNSNSSKERKIGGNKKPKKCPYKTENI